MALYFWQASYTASGVQGLRKDGGTARKKAVEQMIQKAGGRLHSLYFAFGEADVLGVAEFPDVATAAAVSLAVNSSGAVQFRTTPLITPEEMDAAAGKAVAYQAPGT